MAQYRIDHQFINCAQDIDAQLELITNDLTKKYKCYFRGFDLIPSMHYDMLKQTTDKRYKIGENQPTTNNFIQFAYEGVMYFIWIDPSDPTENMARAQAVLKDDFMTEHNLTDPMYSSVSDTFSQVPGVKVGVL
ncbi:MAG: hypothetical protein GY861_26070, partial [bacterium]|nr:hypothetical protein [bacterium]